MARVCQSEQKSYEKGPFSCENGPFTLPFGGDKRDRTADLLNAIQALSQLSYTPEYSDFMSEKGKCVIKLKNMVATLWVGF